MRVVRALTLADEARQAQGDTSIGRYAANASLLGEVLGCHRQRVRGASVLWALFGVPCSVLKFGNLQESRAHWPSRQGQLMRPKLLQRAQDQVTACHPALALA